jgi:hypothetical protein
MFEFLIYAGAGFGGFVLARDFVRNRLRFVDGVHHPLVPLAAGVAAALVAWPLALLPVITTATAAVFGIGAGMGTRRGQKLLGPGT